MCGVLARSTHTMTSITDVVVSEMQAQVCSTRVYTAHSFYHTTIHQVCDTSTRSACSGSHSSCDRGVFVLFWRVRYTNNMYSQHAPPMRDGIEKATVFAQHAHTHNTHARINVHQHDVICERTAECDTLYANCKANWLGQVPADGDETSSGGLLCLSECLSETVDHASDCAVVCVL